MCLPNTCIGLCFATPNETTLDKMSVVYTQTDFLASVNVFFSPTKDSYGGICVSRQKKVSVFDVLVIFTSINYEFSKLL